MDREIFQRAKKLYPGVPSAWKRAIKSEGYRKLFKAADEYFGNIKKHFKAFRRVLDDLPQANIGCVKLY